MVFRPGGKEDREQLCRLNQAFNGPGDKTPAAVGEDLSSLPGELTFVAEEAGELVGFCCCQVIRSWCYPQPAAQLTELYVAPAHRRKGAAAGLLALAEKACAALGAEGLTLLTGEDNRTARAFYESQGYRLSGEVHYEKEW